MKSPVWKKALRACADPQRAKHFLDLLAATPAGDALARFTGEQARLLVGLLSGSQAQGNLLLAHTDWLAALEPGALKFPRRKQGMWHEVRAWLNPLLDSRDYGLALSRLRQFKQREMLRVAARDLARLADVSEITQEISDVADICLESVWEVCGRQFAERFGRPAHQDADGQWRATDGCVLGLGKLGGQELNYSSDVDVIVLYREEGRVFKGEEGRRAAIPRGGTAEKGGGEGGPAAMSNHQFFNRLTEAFIAEVTRVTADGMLYRIDLRLRPEGEAGPLSRSLSGYENYYAQWGQTWERMMLIKARRVAGHEALAAEFLEMIQPFRYPRSISPGAFSEVGAMKDRIENEVVRAGELDRNVKLGRGGIREIEFIVQAQQLLHAGRQPFLQGAQTLPCLAKLAEYELLAAEDSTRLAAAYSFLREVEHRLQMDDNRQTHTIPNDHRAQQRLARLMGFQGPDQFETARRNHAGRVRQVFDKVLKAEAQEPEPAWPFPREFEGAQAEWKDVLVQHRFQDADKAFRVLREFVEGPGYIHVSRRTNELAFRLVPRLLALCAPRPEAAEGAREERVPKARNRPARGRQPESRLASSQPPLSDPDRVVVRLDSFISAYGARATLFELWNRTPSLFELLVLLFDRSEFLAELAIRTPDLVDELVTSGRLQRAKPAEDTLRDLRHGLEDPDQRLWLRRYHQAELMRIGLRDILGLAEEDQYLTELSALAEACLQYALEVVMRRSKLKHPPFSIIGLGKLGGAEIDYGSDLDLLFVADSKARNVSKLGRLAAEVIDLLSRRTEQGLVFHTDARLRPDGEKGLLVNTLKAFEDYYRQRAQLWEIQTLTRTRPIAGDPVTGMAFQKLAGQLSNFKHPHLPLAAYAADWKARIHQMRLRIERERTPRGKEALAIKTGAGGLMDAEFIAQALCLEHGWHEPNTLSALQRGQQAGALPEPAELMAAYHQLRRVEGILRRWSYEGESVLPDDPAPYFRVSVRCGFASPYAFGKALAEWRRQIRKVYQRMLGGAEPSAGEGGARKSRPSTRG